MNYYIDFDNTLYNTPLLTERMLNSIVLSVSNKVSVDSKKLYQECLEKFNQLQIYKLAEYIAKEYNLSSSEIINNLNTVILNSGDLVFEDSIPFLKKLKEKGHKLYILSYCKYGSEFQAIKIAGSKLTDFFDAIFLTSIPKYTLDIDYKNGIFIDDNSNDLLGLYSANAKQVIRLRRNGNIHSLKSLDNINIKEYTNFNDIKVI